MSNIKVSLRKSLSPGRSEYQSSKIMTVVSVAAQGNQYKHSLVGTGSKMIKLLGSRYAVGDRLVVSDGEVIGRSVAKASENTFYI